MTAKRPRKNFRKRIRQTIGDDPEWQRKLAEAAQSTAQAFDLYRQLNQIEAAARDILRKRGLADEIITSRHPMTLEKLVVEELDHDFESDAGYAARILKLASHVRAGRSNTNRHLANGELDLANQQIDTAIVYTLWLGQLLNEAIMKDLWARGYAQLADSRKGAERGNTKRADYEELRKLFAEKRPAYERDEDAHKAVGRLKGVSARTVRRAVKGS
jgi:hypothetical protein